MHFLTFVGTTALFLSSAVAFPSDNSTVLRRQIVGPGNDNSPTCGTTSDATLSDCQALFDNWSTLTPDWSRTCTVGGISPAWNPTCSPGNCCVYVDYVDALWSDVRDAVGQILGCGDASVDRVNGRVAVRNVGSVCLSDGNGCSDCFDD